MEETERKRVSPLMGGVLAAVLIVCLVGIGAIAKRTPLLGARAPLESANPAGKPLDAARSDAGSERDATTPLCGTCGTVESVRPLVVNGGRTVHRVTIRMDDGSYRTISQPVEPGYGVGEKVRIIDGSVVARE